MKKTLVLICISLMLFGLWGCSAAPAEKDQTTDNEMTNTGNSSTGLQHGEKDEKGRVYVDTSIVDIDNTTDAIVFMHLFELYYGGFDWREEDYYFVTDENEYGLKDTSYGIYIRVRPSEYDSTYTEKVLEYDFQYNYIGHYVESYENGKTVYMFNEYDGNTTEHKWDDNGNHFYTETSNGVVTLMRNSHTAGDDSYYDYYKDGNKEITLTYDASGSGLVGYKYVDLRDGSVYDWVLDGNGREPENILSVTITENGWSNTYTGRNEIPWGAAIVYPPRTGSYE